MQTLNEILNENIILISSTDNTNLKIEIHGGPSLTFNCLFFVVDQRRKPRGLLLTNHLKVKAFNTETRHAN